MDHFRKVNNCFWLLFTRVNVNKNTIIAESGAGTMHDLRKIAAGEPRAMEGNLGRAPPVSYHIEVRNL